MEYFTFALVADILGKAEEIPLFAIAADGKLTQFQTVEFDGEDDLPSQGVLAVEDDRPLIAGLEAQMIGVYGSEIVRRTLAEELKSGEVDLGATMLRDVHMADILQPGNDLSKLKWLYLNNNGYGDDGVEALMGAAEASRLKGLLLLSMHANGVVRAAGDRIGAFALHGSRARQHGLDSL